MTPADAKASLVSFVNEIGEQIFVRRFTGTGPTRTHVDTPVQARVMGFAPEKIVGAVVQGDINVIAPADPLAAILPISTNDVLVVRGVERAIKAVDDNTRRIGGVLVGLNIQAAGG